MNRIYIDTSVFGGCFDDEFREESTRFFEFVYQNKIILLISPILLEELEKAPDNIKKILSELPDEKIEYIETSMEAILLRNSYIESGILSEKWINDAAHVALATIYRADAIVSWNFRHIVRLDKIKMFNQVNLLNGYGVLTIISPMEVFYE